MNKSPNSQELQSCTAPAVTSALSASFTGFKASELQALTELLRGRGGLVQLIEFHAFANAAKAKCEEASPGRQPRSVVRRDITSLRQAVAALLMTARGDTEQSLSASVKDLDRLLRSNRVVASMAIEAGWAAEGTSDSFEAHGAFMTSTLDSICRATNAGVLPDIACLETMLRWLDASIEALDSGRWEFDRKQKPELRLAMHALEAFVAAGGRVTSTVSVHEGKRGRGHAVELLKTVLGAAFDAIDDQSARGYVKDWQASQKRAAAWLKECCELDPPEDEVWFTSEARLLESFTFWRATHHFDSAGQKEEFIDTLTLKALLRSKGLRSRVERFGARTGCEGMLLKTGPRAIYRHAPMKTDATLDRTGFKACY